MGQLRDRMQQDLEMGGYAPGTVALYLSYVAKYATYFGRSPAVLGQEHLREFARALAAKGLSASTVHGYLSALKFVYARTLGRPEAVAWISFPKKKRHVPTVLSGSQVRRLIDAIQVPTYRALASTLYGAGLRIGEGVQLEVSDVLSARRVLRIRHGKGGRERYAMLSEQLLATLRGYWREVRPPQPLLFRSPHTGRQLSKPTFRKALRRATRAAGIDVHVTPHTLRHCFATHLLEMGVEMRIIQQLLGHVSIRSTGMYAQVTHGLVRRILSPLDVLGTSAASILG